MAKTIEIKWWEKYGKLTLTWNVKSVLTWKTRARYVECVCECWNRKWISLNSIRQWKQKSCWCWIYTHWMTHTRLFTIFDHIKQRCTNPNNPNRPIYWWKWVKNLRTNFEEFYKDMWESYYEHVKKYWEKETTIDRINWNWDYCKENCRWATRLEQSNNLSSNRSVVYKGKYYNTLSSLCRDYWIKPTTLNMRLNRYWLTLEEAIELPKQSRKWWFSSLK